MVLLIAINVLAILGVIVLSKVILESLKNVMDGMRIQSEKMNSLEKNQQNASSELTNLIDILKHELTY